MPGDSPTPEEMSAYQAAAAKAGRDVLAHIRLASWCEIHGMQIERHKHLGIALELAPDHPAVHGLLGQVRDNGEWRMPQAVVEDYRSNARGKGDSGELSCPPREESRYGPGALATGRVV